MRSADQERLPQHMLPSKYKLYSTHGATDPFEIPQITELYILYSQFLNFTREFKLRCYWMSARQNAGSLAIRPMRHPKCIVYTCVCGLANNFHKGLIIFDNDLKVLCRLLSIISRKSGSVTYNVQGGLGRYILSALFLYDWWGRNA